MWYQDTVSQRSTPSAQHDPLGDSSQTLPSSRLGRYICVTFGELAAIPYNQPQILQNCLAELALSLIDADRIFSREGLDPNSFAYHVI